MEDERYRLSSVSNLSSFCLCLLQAKIAFLQGERRGHENLMRDLVRRIKMLEFALKQERSVSSSLLPSSPLSPPPSPPLFHVVSSVPCGIRSLYLLAHYLYTSPFCHTNADTVHAQ